MMIKEKKKVCFTKKNYFTKEKGQNTSGERISFFHKAVDFLKSKLAFFMDPYYGEDEEDIQEELQNISHEEKFSYGNKDRYYREQNSGFFGSRNFLGGENINSKDFNEEFTNSTGSFVEEMNKDIVIQKNFIDDINVYSQEVTIEEQEDNKTFQLEKDISADEVYSKENNFHEETRLSSLRLFSEEEKEHNNFFVENNIEAFYEKDKEEGKNSPKSNHSIPYETLKSKVRKLTFKDMNNYLLNENLILNLDMKKEIGFINSDGFYTNLALLFSEQCDHSIKVNVYEGLDKSQIKEKKEFKGSLLKQYLDTTAYINNINCGKIIFKDVESYVKRDYEPEKIKEILLNGIVHRDYNKKVSTIINIYEDKIEFISYGRPTDGFDEDLLKLGLVPNPRNSKLMEIFEKLSLVNSCGSGMEKILDDIEFVDKTIVKVIENGFYISLNNRNYQKPERILATKKRNIRRIINRNLPKINNDNMVETKEMTEKEVFDILYQDAIPEVIEAVPQIKYFTYQIDKIYNFSNTNEEDQSEDSYVGQNQQRLPFDKAEHVEIMDNISKTLSHENYKQEKINTDSLDINRQYEKILKYARKKEYITRKDLEKKLKLKQSRVLYILKDMTEKGLLIKNGVGKSTYYKAMEQ